ERGARRACDRSEGLVMLEVGAPPGATNVRAPRRRDRVVVACVEMLEQVEEHDAGVERVVWAGGVVSGVTRATRDAEAQGVLKGREGSEAYEAARLPPRCDEERR